MVCRFGAHMHTCKPSKTIGAQSTHTTSTHNHHNQHAQPSHHLLLLLVVIVLAVAANILAQLQQRWQRGWRWRWEGKGGGDGAIFCCKAYPEHASSSSLLSMNHCWRWRLCCCCHHCLFRCPCSFHCCCHCHLVFAVAFS